MTAFTLLGMACAPHGGLARRAELVQPELRMVAPLRYVKPPPVLRRTHFSLDALKLRSTQKAFVPVRVGHTEDVIGRVAHLELDASGALWMVASAHRDLSDAGPLYLSPEVHMRRDGGDIAITGVGVTAQPAQILLEPITILDGGLDRRRHWRLSGRHAALVERAASTVRGRRPGDPLVVFDPDADRHEDRVDAELGMLPRRG